jgi:heme/copper-type cytochrome/quinol oxidase subunit 1
VLLPCHRLTSCCTTACFDRSLHNVIIGGVLFGVMAAVTYWYPKAFGYKLNEFWASARSFCSHRVLLAFMPPGCAGPDGRPAA